MHAAVRLVRILPSIALPLVCAAAVAVPGVALAQPMGAGPIDADDPVVRAVGIGFAIATFLLYLAVIAVLVALAVFLVRRSRSRPFVPTRPVEITTTTTRAPTDVSGARPLPT